jgi:hypothetical protein
VPAASGDLTARLLARTGGLAGAPGPGAEPAGGADTVRSLPNPAGIPLPGRSRPLRQAFRLAGGVAASAALIGGATYLAGGDTPPAGGFFASAFPGRLSLAAVSAEGGAGAGFPGAGPDAVPADSLSPEQLVALRAGGWACPELRELGYHVVWARGGVADGADLVELRLTDGRHFATVLEQHAPSGSAARQGQPDTAVPLNVLTGHPAAEDGFVAAPAGVSRPGVPVPPAGTVWVNAQAPFRAIYRTPAATFTYVSDVPAEQAGDGVAALVRAAGGPAAAAPQNDVPSRLERGLDRVMKQLAG